MSQPIVGLDYAALKKCYLICIANFTLLANKADFANDYRFRGREGNDLTDDETIVFIELPKIDKALSKPVSEMTSMWALFFRYLTDRGKRDVINQIINRKEGVKMATAVLESISKNEKERIRYENELIFDLDQRSRVNAARIDGITEVARNMVFEGEPVEKIMRYTGLKREVIEDMYKQPVM
jgi:predicted transposase/invertase (TIGR01784 family)